MKILKGKEYNCLGAAVTFSAKNWDYEKKKIAY